MNKLFFSKLLASRDAFTVAPKSSQLLTKMPNISPTVSSNVRPAEDKCEFEEARLCFNVEAYRAAVAMCEIAMEATWRDQESSGLSELKEKGIISLNLYDRANEIRLWANVVKHELVPDAVTKDDAAQLITYLESVLYHIYVEPAKLDIVRRNRKELKNKQLD